MSSSFAIKSDPFHEVHRYLEIIKIYRQVYFVALYSKATSLSSSNSKRKTAVINPHHITHSIKSTPTAKQNPRFKSPFIKTPQQQQQRVVSHSEHKSNSLIKKNVDMQEVLSKPIKNLINGALVVPNHMSPLLEKDRSSNEKQPVPNLFEIDSEMEAEIERAMKDAAQVMDFNDDDMDCIDNAVVTVTPIENHCKIKIPNVDMDADMGFNHENGNVDLSLLNRVEVLILKNSVSGASTNEICGEMDVSEAQMMKILNMVSMLSWFYAILTQTLLKLSANGSIYLNQGRYYSI